MQFNQPERTTKLVVLDNDLFWSAVYWHLILKSDMEKVVVALDYATCLEN